MDVDGRGVVWAGCGMGGWPVGGAHGRDLGSTAPTPVDPGAARARHNPTEPSAGPAGDGGGGSRVLAGGAEGIRTPDPLTARHFTTFVDHGLNRADAAGTVRDGPRRSTSCSPRLSLSWSPQQHGVRVPSRRPGVARPRCATRATHPTTGG